MSVLRISRGNALSAKAKYVALTAVTLGWLITGCGQPTAATSCSVGELTAKQTDGVDFTLTPTDPDLTIFPGQTKQIAVSVGAIGSATGTVQIAGSAPVSGIKVTGASAPIGGTATLTITATNTVAPQCFAGASGVYTAGVPMTLTGTSAHGVASKQVGLSIVLENPTFVPTTTDLPVMKIVTANAAPVDSEDNYVNATVSITDPAKPSNDYTGTTGIKGHGNSTWLMPKKPYRLNLDSKAPLLGMTSDTNWILLANYDDKSMLRTDVSFMMSQMFGMAWTPSTAFVEVYLNGQYEGTYEMSEKVEVSKARLNIGSIDDDDNSGENLTGGYLGEIDHYDGETVMLTSMVGLPIGIADPDPTTTQQAAYFTAALKTAEASMYAANFTDVTAGWQGSWDKSSVVNWFLVEELAGNQDADDWSSDYFYKPRGDALFYRGPVWDMDLTFGNVNYSAIVSPSVPWVGTQSKWYVQLMKDPAFQAAVKARWAAVRPQVETLPAYLDTRAATLTLAAANNYSRWPTLGEKVWPNPKAAGSYQGEVDAVRSWLTQRIAYMDSQYSK